MSATAIRPHEQLLVDLLPELSAQRALCNTAGRAQFAAGLVRSSPQAQVTCWFLDQFQQQQSDLANQPRPGNLHLDCAADPPPEEVELVSWCFSKQGESELVREMLQLGHQRLTIGGQMTVAIDNPTDQWLHEQLRGLFSKVTRRPLKAGVLYLATKTVPLKKIKDYSSEFSYRDGKRLVYLRTRPGVFSHREIDGGARALIKTMEIQPGMRVLDLGSGSGAVGIAAALREDGVEVHAVDSNPRAIEATQWAFERNGISHFSAAVDCDGRSVEPASYDLVLANPPYFSNFRIAELFLEIAAKALVPHGQLLLVTKTPEWYADNLPIVYDEAFTKPVGNYVVLTARKG